MTGVWFISFCKTIQYFDLPSEWFKDSDRSRVCFFTIVIYCSRYPRKWKLVKKTRNSSAFLRIFLYPLTHFQKIQKDKSKWSLIHAVPIFPNFLSLWRLNSGWVWVYWRILSQLQPWDFYVCSPRSKKFWNRLIPENYDFLDFILLRAMLSRKTLTLGRRSSCLVLLVDNAISSSVLDT